MFDVFFIFTNLPSNFHKVILLLDEISVIRANAKEAIKQQQNDVILKWQKSNGDENKSDIFMNIACLTTGDIFVSFFVCSWSKGLVAVPVGGGCTVDAL